MLVGGAIGSRSSKNVRRQAALAKMSAPYISPGVTRRPRARGIARSGIRVFSAPRCNRFVPPYVRGLRVRSSRDSELGCGRVIPLVFTRMYASAQVDGGADWFATFPTTAGGRRQRR